MQRHLLVVPVDGFLAVNGEWASLGAIGAERELDFGCGRLLGKGPQRGMALLAFEVDQLELREDTSPTSDDPGNANKGI